MFSWICPLVLGRLNTLKLQTRTVHCSNERRSLPHTQKRANCEKAKVKSTNLFSGVSEVQRTRQTQQASETNRGASHSHSKACARLPSAQTLPEVTSAAAWGRSGEAESNRGDDAGDPETPQQRPHLQRQLEAGLQQGHRRHSGEQELLQSVCLFDWLVWVVWTAFVFLLVLSFACLRYRCRCCHLVLLAHVILGPAGKW